MISVLLLGSAKRERAELSRHTKIRARCKNTDGRLVRNAPKDSPCSVPLAKQSSATQNPPSAMVPPQLHQTREYTAMIPLDLGQRTDVPRATDPWN